MLIRMLRWRYATIVLSVDRARRPGLGVRDAGANALDFGGFGGDRTTIQVGVSFPRGSDPESLDRAIREFESIVGGSRRRRAGAGAGLRRRFRADGGPVLEGRRVHRDSRDDAGRADPARGPGGRRAGERLRPGPGLRLRRRRRHGRDSGSSCWATRSKAWSGSRWTCKHRLEAIPRVRNVNINAGSFWMAERAVSVALEPDRGALSRAGITAHDFAAAVAREVRGPQGGMRLELEGDEVLVSLKAEGRAGAVAARARGRDRAQPQLLAGPGARRGERGRARRPRHDQPRGPAVRADRELRLPRPVQAGAAHPRRVHEVDLGAGRLLGGRRPASSGRWTTAASCSGWCSAPGSCSWCCRWRWCSTRSGPRWSRS